MRHRDECNLWAYYIILHNQSFQYRPHYETTKCTTAQNNKIVNKIPRLVIPWVQTSSSIILIEFVARIILQYLRYYFAYGKCHPKFKILWKLLIIFGFMNAVKKDILIVMSFIEKKNKIIMCPIFAFGSIFISFS